MKRLACALLLAFCCATSLGAQAAPEVHDISFTGAETFNDELLRAAIVTTESSCDFIVLCWFGVGVDKRYLDEVGLNGDLVRLRLFYYQRGFRAARIEMDSVRNDAGLDIVFHITEGEPVRASSIAVLGAEEIPDERARRTLLQPLPLALNAPFSLIDYELARDTLNARLANLGYARAEVLANYLIPRDSPRVAHVEFQVVPGDRLRYGEITVQGNERISPLVVRRMLTFGTGDVYSQNDLLQSQRNLFGLETFRHVEIRADVNATTDTLIPVVVQVNEARLHRVRVGVGMSSAEFVNAEGLWTSRSWLGGARRLELRARIYNVLADPLQDVPGFENSGPPYDELSGSLSADFTQPWLFGPRNTLNAGLYAERRSLPDIFVRTARGAYVSFGRGLGRNESFSVGYRPELTALSEGGDLVFCVNFVACGADEIKVLRDPHWLSPLAFSYARDRANNLFSPTAGYAIRLDGEYAAGAIGSDFAYSRLVGEFVRYQQITRGVVFATRVRPGWARALGEPTSGLGLHPQKRFFGGGPNSVRGFAQFRMGPKLLTVNAASTLADSALGGCTAQQINGGTCPVATLAEEHEGVFDVRPVGGAAVVEGNFELRVPFIGEKLRAALFLDYGNVWQQASQARINDIVLTPGFGFRYFSAIGPVRVDIGYNTQGAERLTVLTSKVCYQETATTCVPIEAGQTYRQDTLKNTDELVTLGEVLWNDRPKWSWDRFQLHFSIGQAF